ncbi:hypothetical protein K523DRAFT_72370 [Schizophyllum commune Tattone D]|nr:hypothetical protein K523DRAFT_72370 [Schizophyllum commune Tattone D]
MSCGNPGSGYPTARIADNPKPMWQPRTRAADQPRSCTTAHIRSSGGVPAERTGAGL